MPANGVPVVHYLGRHQLALDFVVRVKPNIAIGIYLQPETVEGAD